MLRECQMDIHQNKHQNILIDLRTRARKHDTPYVYACHAYRAADLFTRAQKTVTSSPMGQHGRPIPKITAAPFGAECHSISHSSIKRRKKYIKLWGHSG